MTQSTRYEWEDLNSPRLTELRNEFRLDDVVIRGTSAFDKQLLLKQWIHRIAPNGRPKRNYYHKSAFEILRDANAGEPMGCTQYALAYVQCAQAFGWQPRKLGVDWDHRQEQPEHHHGVVDVWSPDHKRWYVVDPKYGLHYGLNDEPLNAVEIRREWLKNRGADLVGVVDHFQKEITWPADATGFNTPSNYFWIFISLRNNFFTRPGLFQTQGYLWLDEHNRSKRWYRGNGTTEGSEHVGYQGQFIETDSVAQCFPTLDQP